MTECVIVALPREDSQASRISSEKIAHMTLLYLGELEAETDTQMISEFVEHATSQMQPFGASVYHRGTLGDDHADVLYLAKNELESAVRFRSYLLTNEQINRAYNKAYQYPAWTPHVTLGYPDSPARPIEQTEHLHSYVEFDRIAVWYGDFEGPTFRMTYPDETITEHSMDDIDDFLAHFGVKGMKWGVRRDLKRLDSGAREAYLKKKEAPWVEKLKDPKVHAKVASQANRSIKKETKQLVQFYKDQKVNLRKDAKARKRFEEEVRDLTQSALDRVANKVTKGSRTGMYEPKVSFDPVSGKMKIEYVVKSNDKIVKQLRGINRAEERRIKKATKTESIKHAESIVESIEFDLDEEGFPIISDEVVEHAEDVDDFLAHYGVKGMRWGVRKARDSSSGSRSRKKSSGESDGDESTKKPSKSKNSLSKYSDDKLSSLLSDLKGPDALSDAELTKLTKRMQLEQSYRELKAKQPKTKSKAEKFLDGAKLLGNTANQLNEFLNTPAGKALQSKLKSKVKK